MAVKTSNNAFGTLLAAITSPGQTQAQVSPSAAARLPPVTLASGDHFYATLFNSSNQMEIVRVVDVNVAGGIITFGTVGSPNVPGAAGRGVNPLMPAVTWLAGDSIEVRPCMETIADLSADIIAARNAANTAQATVNALAAAADPYPQYLLHTEGALQEGNTQTVRYLSAFEQANTIVGKKVGMNMAVSDGTPGSFTCRSAGAGDANMAGMSYYNDAYAIKLGVRADGYFGLGGWSRAAWSWYSAPDGTMVAAGDVRAYSDPRLKEKFERIRKPFKILNRLDGGTFFWRRGFFHTEIKAGKRDYGILADQVEAVMPEIVSESVEIEGYRYKVVAYEKLTPVLIEAVRALRVWSIATAVAVGALATIVMVR